MAEIHVYARNKSVFNFLDPSFFGAKISRSKVQSRPETERRPKMMLGFDKSESLQKYADSLPESSTIQKSQNLTFPWPGPIRLPWNITSTTTQEKRHDNGPVKIVFKIDGNMEKKSPMRLRIIKDWTKTQKFTVPNKQQDKTIKSFYDYQNLKEAEVVPTNDAGKIIRDPIGMRAIFTNSELLYLA